MMSFRSGSHLLVVLQLSTPMLLPKQLEALGDVKWDNIGAKDSSSLFLSIQFSLFDSHIFVSNLSNVDALSCFRHQLKILRNIDSHMSHLDTSNKVLYQPNTYLILILLKKNWIFIPSQEKYNFAIITEHCCDDEAAEFEASLKKLDFIQNYEVKFKGQWIALFEWFRKIFSFIILCQ